MPIRSIKECWRWPAVDYHPLRSVIFHCLLIFFPSLKAQFDTRSQNQQRQKKKRKKRLNSPLVETQWDLSVPTKTSSLSASFGGIDGHCYLGCGRSISCFVPLNAGHVLCALLAVEGTVIRHTLCASVLLDSDTCATGISKSSEAVPSFQMFWHEWVTALFIFLSLKAHNDRLYCVKGVCFHQSVSKSI